MEAAAFQVRCTPAYPTGGKTVVEELIHESVSFSKGRASLAMCLGFRSRHSKKRVSLAECFQTHTLHGGSCGSRLPAFD